VDVRKGLVRQTLRHSYIVGLFGIRHVVLAVNKMDLVGFAAEPFQAIAERFAGWAKTHSIEHVQYIPISAPEGSNVCRRDSRMSWYQGPTLLEHLDVVAVTRGARSGSFRFPVQSVNRPHAELRGYCGRVTGGKVRRGDEVTVYPSGRTTRIARIFTADGDLFEAVDGQSVTVTLVDALDVGRGDVLASGLAPLVADQFAAHLVWFDDEPLMPGRQYLMRIGNRTVRATVTTLKHQVNPDTLEKQAATRLVMNEIGVVNLGLDQPVACDKFDDNRETGGFILIDPFSNRTVGAGVIDFALRRAANVQWQSLDVDKRGRARLKQQRPCMLWFTGLSGAGKSTIANLLDRRLSELGRHTYVLDGDNLRHGLNRDLGFTPEGRVENVRRTAEVAKLFVDAGLIVLVALISPFRAERQMARRLVAAGEFVEIHVATSLEECERRDPKGLYRRARAGEIPNFSGIDSPYEPPEAPEIIIETVGRSAEEASELILAYMRNGGYF
jgi:bifunctional enzyme CysN/CysC